VACRGRTNQFHDFLLSWESKLRKGQTGEDLNAVTVMLQNEVDKYNVCQLVIVQTILAMLSFTITPRILAIKSQYEARVIFGWCKSFNESL